MEAPVDGLLTAWYPALRVKTAFCDKNYIAKNAIVYCDVSLPLHTKEDFRIERKIMQRRVKQSLKMRDSRHSKSDSPPSHQAASDTKRTIKCLY